MTLIAVCTCRPIFRILLGHKIDCPQYPRTEIDVGSSLFSSVDPEGAAERWNGEEDPNATEDVRIAVSTPPPPLETLDLGDELVPVFVAAPNEPAEPWEPKHPVWAAKIGAGDFAPIEAWVFVSAATAYLAREEARRRLGLPTYDNMKMVRHPAAGILPGTVVYVVELVGDAFQGPLERAVTERRMGEATTLARRACFVCGQMFSPRAGCSTIQRVYCSLKCSLEVRPGNPDAIRREQQASIEWANDPVPPESPK